MMTTQTAIETLLVVLVPGAMQYSESLNDNESLGEYALIGVRRLI
jgi:hypothetical protein